MLGGADNPNGELPSYITGADMFNVMTVEIAFTGMKQPGAIIGKGN